MFYTNGRHWVFYRNATTGRFVYQTSTDGINWSGETILKDIDHYNSSSWFDGTYIHYALIISSDYNQPIYYRVGSPNSDGSISWLDDEQIAVAGAADASRCAAFVTVDSEGYAWIGWTEWNDTEVKDLPVVTKSSTKDGTWTTASGFPYVLSYDDGAGAINVVPLTDSKMFTIYTIGTNLKARSYTGSTWNDQVTYPVVISGAAFNTVAEDDNVHIVTTNNVNIHYEKYQYSSNSFINGENISSEASAKPKISRSEATLYCFHRGDPSFKGFYYIKMENGVWGEATLWFTEPQTFAGYTSFYNNGNGKIGVNFVTPTGVGGSYLKYAFMSINYEVLIEYVDANGKQKEIISGTKVVIEATLMDYIENKEGLKILGFKFGN